MLALEFEIEQPRQERSRSTIPRKIGLAVLSAVAVVCVCFACKAMLPSRQGSPDFLRGRPERWNTPPVDDDEEAASGFEEQSSATITDGDPVRETQAQGQEVTTQPESEGSTSEASHESVPGTDAVPAVSVGGCEGGCGGQFELCLVEHPAAGCPQLRVKADWPHDDKDAFLKKLTAIQDAAEKLHIEGIDEKMYKCQFEGSAPMILVNLAKDGGPSCMVKNQRVGRGKFYTENECWDAAFLVYASKYNVAPTDAFRRFVDDFDLDAFHRSVEACKTQVRDRTNP